MFERLTEQKVEKSADAEWPGGRGQVDGYPTERGCGLWPPTHGMDEQHHVINIRSKEPQR